MVDRLTSEKDPGLRENELSAMNRLTICRGQFMKRFVEGADRGQSTLLPECLDEWVEESNSVRVVDSICRKFLSEHAPKKADGETAGWLAPKPASPAQLLHATKIALGKGVVIPDEAKANSVAMAAWIDSNKGTKRRKSGRRTTFRPARSISPQSTSPTKRSWKRKLMPSK